MGAPLGNQNENKGKEWTLAIKRALARRGEGDYRRGLDLLADKLVKAAESDEAAYMKAIEVVGDRIEGKATTMVQAQADVDLNISWGDGENTDSVHPAPASGGISQE